MVVRAGATPRTTWSWGWSRAWSRAA